MRRRCSRARSSPTAATCSRCRERPTGAIAAHATAPTTAAALAGPPAPRRRRTRSASWARASTAQWYDEYEDYLISRLGRREQRSWRLFTERRPSPSSAAASCGRATATAWCGRRRRRSTCPLAIAGDGGEHARRAPTVYEASADGSQGAGAGHRRRVRQRARCPATCAGRLAPDQGHARPASCRSARVGLLPVGLPVRPSPPTCRPRAARAGLLRPGRGGHRRTAQRWPPRPSAVRVTRVRSPARRATAAGGSRCAGGSPDEGVGLLRWTIASDDLTTHAEAVRHAGRGAPPPRRRRSGCPPAACTRCASPRRTGCSGTTRPTSAACSCPIDDRVEAARSGRVPGASCARARPGRARVLRGRRGRAAAGSSSRAGRPALLVRGRGRGHGAHRLEARPGPPGRAHRPGREAPQGRVPSPSP